MSNISEVWKLISDANRQIIETANYVFILSGICLFGVVANVMNMAVFCKQGFASTMNISFLGLVISDLCALITLLWCCICVNPLFVGSDISIDTIEIQYLTAGSPHCIFARVTGWITVYITAERCLCITYPLKIKQLITSQRTALTMCAIYFITVVTFIPEFVTCYFDWKFYPERNRSLVGIVFTDNRSQMEGLIFVLYSIMGSASFVAVVVFTAILVVQLKLKSKWRVIANADASSSEAISSRDRKTMSMVVMIASVLIVCYTPGILVSLVIFFEPDITIAGVNVNMFFVLWSFVFIFEAVNSSVNIFLYYKMSSKFRATFLDIFCVLETSKEQQTNL